MSRGGAPGAEAEAVAFATYVANLTQELSKLARDHNFSVLAYLLDVTRLEARTLAEEGANVPGR